MNFLKTSAIVVAICCLALLLADCISGTTKHLECVINDHRYYPAWTETTFSTDSDGNITFSQTDHPEEYHLIATDLEDQGSLDIPTEPYRYNQTTNGATVTVRVRIGKWTSVKWMPQIE